jgi:hypothetical protein
MQCRFIQGLAKFFAPSLRAKRSHPELFPPEESMGLTSDLNNIGQ